MLINHGLENKVLAYLVLALLFTNRCCQQILSYNSDNASCNDTQDKHLERLPNSFESVNRLRCFNHTLQILGRALVHPFLTPLSSGESQDHPDESDDAMPRLALMDAADDDDDDEEDASDDDDDDCDNDDIFMELNDEEREELTENTADIREALDKVSHTEPSLC